eukprot:2790201-Rhodomonas_salina.2
MLFRIMISSSVCAPRALYQPRTCALASDANHARLNEGRAGCARLCTATLNLRRRLDLCTLALCLGHAP